MKQLAIGTLVGLALLCTPVVAQEDGGGSDEIIVTGTMRRQANGPVAIIERRPVIGLRRPADSAVRAVEITSDSLDEGLRRREVRAMLFAAIDRAKAQGFNVVTGHYTVKEVTKANWQELFPDLAVGSDSNYSDDDESWQADEDDDDDDDYDDDDDDNNKVKPAFEDDDSTTTLRLKIKTKLEGTIDAAERKISGFVKAVPATGRSLMKQKGIMALTIISPEQYRDEIYKRIATGAQHAAGFYGNEPGLEVNGLHSDVQWEQVSDTELFLFIRYNFLIKK
jgi:hypothetical protein